ncbi:thiamine-phosphate kinase [Microbacterium sp. YY-01]|uniref:thiamine-phosphate kinase n=1 Tax=Microbacterium sp. YY-01 TaxID=3421634 RepID=UPI003D1666E9
MTHSASPDDPRLSEISEGTVLRTILQRTPDAAAALIGPGDDAALISAASGAVVATTDTLVHGPDFRLSWSSGFDLGWKAAAVNLADVAAMGARPTALLVALAVPGEIRLSFVAQLADGLREACAALAPGCSVVGGDLTISDTLMIAVTALGDLEGRAAVTRGGAQAGDAVALCGDMGVAAEGLRLLFERYGRAQHPGSLDDAEWTTDELRAVMAQLRPDPPIAAGPHAARAGATAMMDVSDGLALDAHRLAEASHVTINFDSAALGPQPQRALAGGEDHALLATFAPDAVPDGFRVIGRVRERGEHGILCDGAPIDAAGWDPYRDAESAESTGSTGSTGSTESTGSTASTRG